MNEELILTNLLDNEVYMKKVLAFLSEDYFSDRVNKEIFKQYIDYFNVYNLPPNREVLLHKITSIDDLGDVDYLEAIERVEELIQDELPNIDWLYDTTEKFCQDRSLHSAIQTAMYIFEGKNNDGLTTHAIPDIIKDALAVSFTTSIGHDYFEDSEERYKFYNLDHPRIPFDIKLLNMVTNGGVPRKTLNIILAGVNVGKSLSLCHLGASYMSMGYNVLYVTFEMSQEAIANRIDANLMNIEVNSIENMAHDKFTSNIKRIKDRTKGRLIIKEYPTSSAHSGHIETLINELTLKSDFKPDVILVDYIGIMASSRVSLSNTGSYFYIKAIAEELRALAVIMDAIVWTAVQVTRGGFNDTDIDITATAESFGLPATADFMISLVRTEELDALGQLMVKQLKSRYGNKGYYERFVIGVNISKMQLFDVDDDAQITQPNDTAPPEKDKFEDFVID
jgi:replicative DNA helicase